MDRARRNNSKIPTAVAGNLRISRQKSGLKLASESGSCRGSATEEGMRMIELGPSSSKQINGVPIKKLLAVEMSKDAEVKRRSPSIVARLMGLDGLPPPQPVQKTSKMWSDNQQCTASTRGKKNVQHHDVKSNQTNPIEHQEFKDVYEDLEASHAANRKHLSKWMVNSKSTKSEMAFRQQKFLHANCHSTDEKHHNSKGLSKTFEIVESSKDLRVWQTDPLFAKQMQDMQYDVSSSPCNYISVLKPVNSEKYEGSSMERKSEREKKYTHKKSSHRKQVDGLLIHSENCHGVKDSAKPSKEEKTAMGIFPTRIIVLKPNLVTSQNARGCASSPDSSYCFQPECRKHKESSDLRTREDKFLNMRPKSKEAREIAKEITRQMRESFGSSAINLSHSVSKGYAGDESSCYSGSDSASDSEAMIPTSRNSFNGINRQKPSYSRSTLSSVTREAKKRLSERWNISHRSHGVGVVDRVSTLGEMLAIPDREIKFRNLDDLVDFKGVWDGHVISNETKGRDSPLTISSNNSSKDADIRNSFRSKSVPPSFGIGNPRTSLRSKPCVSDRCHMLKEIGDQGRSRSVERNVNRKKFVSAGRRSQSSFHTCANNSDNFADMRLSQMQILENIVEKDIFDQQVSEIHTNSDTCTASVVDTVDNVEHFGSSGWLSSKSSTCVLGDVSSSAAEPAEIISQDPSAGFSEGGDVPLQGTGPEPASSESSKEADHPSPVSVLEICFGEDNSSNSQYFEGVGADLRELRMQLQLLKMDSSSEVIMRSSSDEDIGQGSFVPSDEKDVTASKKKGVLCAESWESSYLHDVLVESGFHDMNPDLFMTTWHSPQCVLGPWVFNNLENKYSNVVSGLQVKRKLLFDRINFAFLELFQWLLDPYPYVEQSFKRASPKWLKQGLKDQLQKVLLTQEKSANEIMSEKVLDHDMHWSDFHEEIEVIVKELEKILIDDLTKEVVAI